MKGALCSILAILCLTATACAASWEFPENIASRELSDALPDGASEYLDGAETLGPSDFVSGVGRVLNGVRRQFGTVFRERAKGAAAVLMSVILCGAVRSGTPDDESASLCVSMAGALAVTALTAGSLDSLIGLGWRTIGELNAFSKAFMPTLAAACAASGGVTTATFQQVATAFLVETLLSVIDEWLMPMTYLYIGILTASCALPANALSMLADALKKLISSVLTISVLCFTVYLSVTRVIAGNVDNMAVRAVRTAVTTAVPVVGGILAQASESMLAGAGLLKNTLGVFGMLAVLGACARPFVELGIQYLLYKGVAVLTAATGMDELGRLINGLGGAFGLVLGMTGACALLLFVSALTLLSAVV